MSIVVTGGAGFIGSCIVRQLNDMGMDDIIVVDHIASTEKWKNLCNKTYREYVHKDIFTEKLKDKKYENITAIIHMGACSSTTELNFDYLWQNNVEYSKMLWKYGVEHQIPFLYASSAATYGDGDQGFNDEVDIKHLRPMNGYGYSKQVFDLWVREQINTPSHYAGFKFFNVYGPNEYCKGSMASMIYHGYKQIRERGTIRLFKSCNPEYEDGGQLRDFVYVKDICQAVIYFLDHCKQNGIYNLGTGRAQSFRELAEATFHALGLEPQIEYIDMPENLKEKYQYYTKAEMEKLWNTGYKGEFRNLEQGAKDYVQNHLDRNFEIY